MNMSEETTKDNNFEEIHRLSEELRLPSEAERQNAIYLRQTADNIISSVNFNQEDFNQEDFDKIRPLLANTERLEFLIKDLIKNLVSTEGINLSETTITESLIKAHSLLEQLDETAIEITQKIKEMGYIIEVVNEDTKGNSEPIKEAPTPAVDQDISDKPPVKVDVGETSKQPQTPSAFNSEKPSVENAKDLMSYFRRWQNGDASIFNGGWSYSLNEIKNDIRLFLEAANYSREEINQFFNETVNPWSQAVIQKNRSKGRSEKVGPTWKELSDQILQTVREKLQGKEPNSTVFEENNLKNKKQKNNTVTAPEVKSEVGVEKNESLESLKAEVDSVVKNYHDFIKEIGDSNLLEILQYKIKDAERHIANLEQLLADSGIEDEVKAPKIIKKIRQRIGKLVDLQQEMREELVKTKEGDVTTKDKTETADANSVTTPTGVADTPPAPTPEAPATDMPAEEIKLDLVPTEGDETIPADKEQNPETEATTPTEVKPENFARENYTPERQAERQKLGMETRLARFEMKKHEEAYNQALYQYNVNKKFRDRVIDGVQKWRGQEVTTRYLKMLKAEADASAEKYRTSLLAQISDRNRDRVLETALKTDSEDLHKAFYTKLVTKVDTNEQSTLKNASEMRKALFNNEHPELVALQERVQKLTKYIPKDKKFKLGLRLVGLFTAAGVGATVVPGSIAVGAAIGGSRWLASTLAGMGVGAWVRRREGKKVLRAEDELNQLLAGPGEAKNLSVADMRKSLRLAHVEVEGAKLRRTAKTLLATFAAGFGARGLSGVAELAYDSFTGAGATPDTMPTGKTSNNPVWKDGMLETARIEKPSVGASGVEATSATSAGEVASGHDTNAENISILDQDGPTLSKEQLEQALNERMSINLDPAQDSWSSLGYEHSMTNNLGVGHEANFGNSPAIIHEVKSGENLSTIFHKSLLAQFDEGKLKLPAGVDRSEIAKLLYKKFPEMSNPNVTHWTLSPEEWKELGVKSGNPHLIHPGEQIDLTKLSAKLVDSDLSVGQTEVPITHRPQVDVLSHPKTGPLPVEEIDPFEQQIKIAQETPFKPLSPADLESARAQGILEGTIETAPVKPLESTYGLPPSPTPGKFDSNFYDTPVYQEYLQQNKVDQDLLKKITDKTIAKAEGDTLTTMEEIFGTYDSPYKKLSHLTMGQLEEIVHKVDGSPIKLQQELVKYAGGNANFKLETINAWAELINEVQEAGKIPYNDSTTVADLFKRDMALRLIETNHFNVPAK